MASYFCSTSSILNMFTPLTPTKHNYHQNPLSISTLNTKSSSFRHSYGAVINSSIQNNNNNNNNEVTKVIRPSMSNANIMYYKSAYNVQVLVDDNEPEERLLNRFRREVMRAGVIQECKRRRFFENKQDEKKRKSREAAKRNSRRRRGPFQPRENKEDTAKVAKNDDDQDNWEMPVGDSPF